MKKGNRFIKNTIVFLIAFVFAFALAYFSYDLKDLQASVLGIEERQTMLDNQRNIAYKRADQNLEIFGSDSLRRGDTLTVALFFDPQKVHFDLDTIASPFSFSLDGDAISAGGLEITLKDFESGSFDEGMIQIPFEGEMRDILVESAILTKQGKEESLAIGLLETQNIGDEELHGF